MTRLRYLTKSRFKIANECPTRLFYTHKRKEYADAGFDDPFLAALAEGGFQVGELAKALYPGGVDIPMLEHAAALARTEELLASSDDIVLFEPAFLWAGMFVRVDVLVKRGSEVELIEVKAKSCEGTGEEQFLGKRGGIAGEWRPYLEDAAFQWHVVSHARPEWDVRPSLMLVDKTVACPTDGLHQKFLLERGDDGRAVCRQTADLTGEERASGLLAQVPLVETLRILTEEPEYGWEDPMLLADWAAFLAKKYTADERIWVPLHKDCAKCPFRADAEQKATGLKSGFEECWRRQADFTDADFAQSSILEIWDDRTKDKWLDAGRYRINDLEFEDFPHADGTPGPLARTERQWIQVDKAQRGDDSQELRRDLADEMAQWTFPLHFIDFETMAPAIPMHAGCRPYEVLAFQWSHHEVHENGRVEHAGEYIDERVGAFPNFAFVRALRAELAGDEGTIFRYHNHENTVLRGIRRQLMRARATVADADVLIDFIESITKPTGDEDGATGRRSMVDMHRLVRQYHYDPRTNGSNSLKKVLPATLRRSDYLRERYSQPIYGADGGSPSLNFRDHVWVELEGGEPRDPYELLPDLFEGLSAHDRERLQEEGLLTDDQRGVADGGAAMTAFARMQFTEMGDAERARLRQLLLQYCELDTFAMVLLYEAWREWLR